MPDRTGEDAAACPVVEPGEHDRAAGEAEDESDVADRREVAVRGDGEEQGHVPDRPDRGYEQRGGEGAVATLQLGQREAAPADLLAEGGEHHDHRDGQDADRRQAAEPAEVAPPGQRAGGQRNRERNARNASGLSVAAHQRAGMRQRPIRPSRSRTPPRPQTSAVTTNAARAGPRSAGRCVGQPTAPLDDVVRGHEREHPRPRDRVRQDHERRQRP